MRRSTRFVTERAAASDRSSSAFIQRATCSDRRRYESPVRKACGWSPGTTNAFRTRLANLSSRCAATRSSRSRRSVCRSIGGTPPEPSSPTSWTGGGAAARAARPRCCSATRLARRSDSWRSWRASPTGRVLVHGGMAGIIEVYRAAGMPMLDPSTVVAERRARHVVRGRARAGAAVCPRHAVDAAARRVLRCFVSGLMRVRGVRRQRNVDRGLRAVRSCRLAGSARDDRRGRRQPRPRDATAMPNRSRAIFGTRASTAASSGRRGSARGRQPHPSRSDHASIRRLFAALDQTTSTNAKVDGDADYFGSAPPADARVGDLLSDRPALEAPRAVGGDPRLDACRDRPERMDARRMLFGRGR